MKLPNAHLAVVEERKIVEYLLNPSHPENGGKAKFFNAMGFTALDWNVLAAALRCLAVETTISSLQQSVHGSKFVVDGEIVTPVGRRPRVRTVWVVDVDGGTPRLVTAYPFA